jgi:uncharacterized SAM-binding protein YcdF (DUF218 family)
MVRYMKKGLTRLLAGLGGLWILLTVSPLVPWWTNWLSAGYVDEARPVLIVLAGDSSSDTVMGYSTYLRSVYAFWFWQRHRPDEIVLSGGPQEHPMASLMADLLTSLGVPRDQVRVEISSTNTRENLAGVAEVLHGDARPATLLTSDFHMRRALLLARRHHLSVVPYPAPDIGKRFLFNRWGGLGLSIELASETAKLFSEYLRN